MKIKTAHASWCGEFQTTSTSRSRPTRQKVKHDGQVRLQVNKLKAEGLIMYHAKREAISYDEKQNMNDLMAKFPRK